MCIVSKAKQSKAMNLIIHVYCTEPQTPSVTDTIHTCVCLVPKPNGPGYEAMHVSACHSVLSKHIHVHVYVQYMYTHGSLRLQLSDLLKSFSVCSSSSPCPILSRCLSSISRAIIFSNSWFKAWLEWVTSRVR